MKKRIIGLLLVCVLCCAALFSCGDANGAESTDAQTTQNDAGTDSTSAETDNPAGPVSTEDKIKAMKNIKSIKDITPSSGSQLKIAFIGDSITQGSGVGAENFATQSYPAQLGALLGSSYQIGNFGRASAYTLAADNQYNVKTDASLSYRNTSQYQDSVVFDADVVVIMMGVNDIRSMSCEEARVELKKALADLALEYCEMESVQKVYIATSIFIPSSAAIVHYSYGRLAELQKEVADEMGLDVIDIFEMTREYMNVMMHYTGDRIHPVKESYGEMARAFYSALMGEEYKATVPAVSDTGVVYVKAGGASTGKGESPENAIDSLAKAVGLLRDGGGTIVICGPYSLEYEMHMPHHDGMITITSKHNGTDYAQSASAKLGIAHNLYLNGDYTFENMPMVSEVANSFITCNYNNVIFGDNINSSLASGITTYPLILVGYNMALGGPYTEDITLHGECNITVNSGTWVYLRGGNRRSNPGYPNAASDNDAILNITINGGTFTSSTGTNLTAGTGMGGLCGTLNFTINGGKFMGNVYAVGRSGTNTTQTKGVMTGTVNMTVTGGEFSGIIGAFQDSTTEVTGKINLTITDALKSKASGFSNITVQ